MAEMQNSNPTILNAADLPTRLRPTTTRKSEYAGIFTSALPLAPVDFESTPSSDSEDDNLLEEPIDEQEIYGKALSCISRGKKKKRKPIYIPGDDCLAQYAKINDQISSRRSLTRNTLSPSVN